MAKSKTNGGGSTPPTEQPSTPRDRILAALAKARETAKSTEGQVPTVIASATPKVAKVVSLTPAKGDGDRVYGLNMGLEFDPKTPVYASFEIGKGKDGHLSVLQSRRRTGASPEYTAAIWTGKPGQKAALGGNCLAVCVPMGRLLPVAQAFVAAVEADAGLEKALTESGLIYSPAAAEGVEARRYLAVSLQDAGLPLYCFGETQPDGTVRMVANHRMGPWALGEYPSPVTYENSDGSRSQVQYLRGRPYGVSRQRPESFAFKVLSGVVAQALAIEGTAKAVADFRGARAPFGMTRGRGRQGFRQQAASQAPAPVAAPTGVAEGASEDDLRFES